MSNYHVLDMTTKKHEIHVIYHIAIPNTNNSAGTNYRTALKEYLDSPTTKVPWDIGAEATQVANGELYEHEKVEEVDADLTLAQKRTILDNNYTSYSTSIQNKMTSKLDFWGMNRDVP